MKPKDKFLQNIQIKVQEHHNKANEYQRIYDFNKDLPDEVFENLNEESQPKTESLAAKVQLQAPKESNSDYGLNRKLVVQVLNEEQKVMRKGVIADKFRQLHPASMNEGDATSAVTNVLSALKIDKSLKTYKPKGAKFKGYYWGLSTWFEGDVLKEEHQPEPHNALNSYLQA